MNGPVKLRDFLRTPAATAAREFNDKLRSALVTYNCPFCDLVLQNPGQTHECRREVAVR